MLTAEQHMELLIGRQLSESEWSSRFVQRLGRLHDRVDALEESHALLMEERAVEHEVTLVLDSQRAESAGSLELWNPLPRTSDEEERAAMRP